MVSNSGPNTKKRGLGDVSGVDVIEIDSGDDNDHHNNNNHNTAAAEGEPRNDESQRIGYEKEDDESISSPEVVDMTDDLDGYPGEEVIPDQDFEIVENDEADDEVEPGRGAAAGGGFDKQSHAVSAQQDYPTPQQQPQSRQSLASSSQKQIYPDANEFDALAKKLMKPIPDYPVADQTHFVWEIKDWASFSKEMKVRSPRYKCGGFEWSILLFPRGNNQSGNISAYMEPHPPQDETTGQPKNENWYVCAQFAIDIWNPLHPEAHSPSQSSHRFSKTDTDWGFGTMVDRRQLLGKRYGKSNQTTLHSILENNQLNLTGYVRVIDDSSTGVLWHNFNNFDSKLNSGYVGLNNQGATCYLNSLLQSYFTTKQFRKLVYEIPTKEGKNSEVALALQRIFYLLSSSSDPVGTMELTKSFGWDSSEAFTQHDVQELNRILMDKLETAMKGSAIENGLNDIFVGKMKSYIKCVDVPYESSRVEDFWDIQLNVKGFKNLEESFKNYIEIEMLDGENKYQAGENFGYQDAKKGVVFESFPPVLHLQLKRFEYDFMVDDLVKIDDFYEFPDNIDLKPYLDEDLPEEVKSQNWNYKLHGVLVHQGTISNGHYYAMIKPNAYDDTWLRFDDDKVWKATSSQVFQENFGASDLSSEELASITRTEQQEHFIRRVTSAYMLVYYRETELDKILPADESAIKAIIPEHVSKQIQFEIEEKERLERERQEALYYVNLKLITTSTINSHLGFDLALDPTVSKYYESHLAGTESDPKVLKVRKDSMFSHLMDKIRDLLGYESNSTDSFRLVSVCHRNNHTNRLDGPVEDEGNALVSSVVAKNFNRKYDEAVFYVEELNKDIRNINKLAASQQQVVDPAEFKFSTVFDKIKSVGTKLEEDMKFKSTSPYSGYNTILIKYFDPTSQEIRTLSHITVGRNDTIKSIISPIRELLGFPATVELELYEELSPMKLEALNTDLTFDKQELNNGDIITVQVSNVQELAGANKRFKTIKDYYKFLATRVHIRVKPYSANTDVEDSEYLDEGDEDEDEDKENGFGGGAGGGGAGTNGAGGNDAVNGEDNDQTTIKEIEIAKKLSKSFELWIPSNSSYFDLAEEISKVIKCDSEYLKLFIIGNQGQRYTLKSTHVLSHLFPRGINVDDIIEFEYEVLNIRLKEYENLKSFKVYWLNNLLQYQMFELLVPRKGDVRDLVNKLLHKVNVPEKYLKYLLCWSGVNHSFRDIIKFETEISNISESVDIYCGVFPAEIAVLCDHGFVKRFTIEPASIDETEIEDKTLRDEFVSARELSKNLNIIPAFHFHKNSSNHHGIPFLFVVFPNEPFEQTKERLRLKLGLGKQAFDKVRLALADMNDKGMYLDEGDENLVLFDKLDQRRNHLALDHPDRDPKRQNTFDKGISIK
ncbi:uncharacterized protein LODBEIA_P38000 [Lodderomyces beijingensis]|uniref:ubiquitinyl hydrolase 1 n=1 Tax=Lodderomyces beijingensis TaxID=1775926 RepID=A0ABP0ZR74_9ASCO